MRHKRFRFGHMRLNGIPVNVRYGDLLVAQNDCNEQIDWEVVVKTTDRLTLEPSAYDVHVETSEDRQLWGAGVLVRTEGRAHVFRGGGTLDGFDVRELS